MPLPFGPQPSRKTTSTSLGLGTAATHNTGDFLQTANNLSEVTAATARTNLGLGTAATHATTDYDAAGAAATVNTALGTHTAATGTSVHGLGTASTVNTGTTTGTIPVLIATNALPVVSGANLTNLPAPTLDAVVAAGGVTGRSIEVLNLDAEGTLNVDGTSTFGGTLTLSGVSVVVDPGFGLVRGANFYQPDGDGNGTTYARSYGGFVLQMNPGTGFINGFVISDSGGGTFLGPLTVGGVVGLKAYTVATLPTAGTVGRAAFASDGRKAGELMGAGTGVFVTDDGTAWRCAIAETTVAA